jgi:hypothetical protein
MCGVERNVYSARECGKSRKIDEQSALPYPPRVLRGLLPGPTLDGAHTAGEFKGIVNKARRRSRNKRKERNRRKGKKSFVCFVLFVCFVISPGSFILEFASGIAAHEIHADT